MPSYVALPANASHRFVFADFACRVPQGVFSVILLGLTAARIHYTTNLPSGDPLNGGHDFYGQSLVLVLVLVFRSAGTGRFDLSAKS